MRRTTSALDRLIVAAAGLILAAAGAAVLAWNFDLGPAREWANKISVPKTADWPHQQWWPWVVGATALLALILALWLLRLNLARRRVATIRLSGTGPEGALTADLGAVASASAQCLEQVPFVHSASAKSREDRRRPTIDLVAHCDPDVDLKELKTVATTNASAVSQSLPESGVTQRVFVRVDRLRAR